MNIDTVVDDPSLIGMPVLDEAQKNFLALKKLREDYRSIAIHNHALYKTAFIKLARERSEIFVAHLLRDEQTGLPIEMNWYHNEWHLIMRHFNRCVLTSHPEAAKTQQISIGYIIWRLGNNPRERWCILSATDSMSAKIITTIGQLIKTNEFIKQVFPALKKGGAWTDTAITIARPSGIKDPSVQCTSPDSQNIQGARLDGLILDDVLTENNTRTKYQRDKTNTWIRSTVFTRMTKDNPKIIMLANAWHDDDLGHRLTKEGWFAKKYPVINKDGSSAWPKIWPLDRIEDRRITLGPIEFRRQMMCEARDESDAVFKRDFINDCLERGVGYDIHTSLVVAATADDTFIHLLDSYPVMPDGYAMTTGVDLAISKASSADLTAISTVLTWPDGSRHLMNIQSGRWRSNEIIDRILAEQVAFGSELFVESNAAQEYLRQAAEDKAPDIVVHKFITGKNKANVDYGVASLAAEMAVGKWVLPCNEAYKSKPEVTALVDELLDYTPGKHTGDRLMSIWIAREGARRLMHRAKRKSSGVTVRSTSEGK